MRRWATRALGLISWGGAAFATLLLALSFVPTLFGLRAMIVSSGSMGKALPVGSVALARPVLAQAIAVGDMISFRYRGNSETITHRVVSVEVLPGQFVFTTKGDANGSLDPEKVVVADRIHRVERVVPFAGYVVRYARTPFGAGALILVPIVGLTFDKRVRGRSNTHARAPRARRRAKRLRLDTHDVGWSTTTYHLVGVTPSLRSDPGG